MLNPENGNAPLEKFSRLQEKLEGLDVAQKVMSLYKAKDFKPSDEGFAVVDLMPEFPKSEKEVADLKKRIQDNDLVYEQLVSRDFQKMAFIVQLKRSSEIDDGLLRENINTLVETFRGPDAIYVSGLPITRSQIQVNMQHDLKRFMPYGILLTIFLLALSFRSWIGVFLPFIIVIISIIWTFGLLSVLGIRFTFIAMLIPVMLIAIANDYGIHIITHYFQHIQANPALSKEEIIRTVMSRLGSPIFLAGITTIIGFMSLLSHIMVDAKKVGLLASFGILIAFILSLTLLPAVLVLLQKPKLVFQQDYDWLLTRFLKKWAVFFTAYPKIFMFLMLVLLVVIGWKIPAVVVDTDPNHYYKEDDPFRVNNERVSEIFGGSTQLSIMVEGDIKEPKILNEMLEMSKYLKQNPSISEVISLADQISRMNEAFHGGDPAFRVIPDSRNLVAQYLLLYSMTGDADDLEHFVDYNYQHAQILVRINRVSTTEINNLLTQIDQYIDQHHDRTVFPSVTGFGAVMGVLIGMLVKGQIISLIVSVGLVFIVTAVVFRSIQGGVFAIIPLSMAIVLVFGLMGFLGIELNAATAMLSSIMIGVGVDYAIHFLWHLRETLRQTPQLSEAIELTLCTSGKGIIFNALSVIVGFMVLLISAFLPIEFFGFLIVLSIGMCLFGALAVLPALITLVEPKFLFKK
ncbi:MMPL family transporter [Deltaproteobacteria bacterium TL4]